MAIDTSMFGVNIPAGTYAKGDVIALKNLRGPAIVRDGYGEARLKRIFCGTSSSASSALIRGHCVVKNSNWIDSISNLCTPPIAIALAENASGIQRGHDAILTPNSGWEVSYVFDEAVTTTTATDAYCLIDVDYPRVQAVQNPRESVGVPMSLMRDDTVTISALGSLESATWTTFNIDVLKAGFRYLLVELGSYIPNSTIAFVSLSGAAGQNGLERIIPSVSGILGTMRYLLDYSTPLVKGPMNLNYLVLGTAGTSAAITEMDWVKR